MNSSRIIFLVILLAVAILGSVTLGYGVAANQSQTLIIGGIIGSILLCVFLGQRIWLLFLFLFNMQVPIIRGLTTIEIGYMILVGFSVLLFLIRKLNFKFVLDELDFWRLAVVLVILQVYVRNPVGLNMFGASSIGGRPYFIAAWAVAASVVLAAYRVPASDLKLTRWIVIAASIIQFPINRFRHGLGRGPALENVTIAEGGIGGESAGRNATSEVASKNISSILTSKISPLKACFHPLWVWLLLFSLAFAALSGYRSAVAYVGLIMLAGIAYHGGFVSMLISAMLGAMGLTSLALFNLAYPLPAKVQRALSPFPGTWDTQYSENADQSTEWRVEMWKAALLTDDWIQNKILGDGLGMSREEHEKMQDMEVRKSRRAVGAAFGLTVQQESMMISGNYHSGPVQTIRTIGYFGLLVMMGGLIRLAVHAHQQIKRCWGTEWQSTMLFFGIPIVVYPPYFFLVFGTFDTAISFFFINSALISLFERNLPLPAYRKTGKAIVRPIAFGQARAIR